GLATLFLADNRDLYPSGPTIAFAICVATFAVLTLTPSLLRLFGGYLFWPAAPGTIDRSDSRIWTAIAATVTRRPVASVLVTLGALLPAIIVGTTVKPLYDSYEEYPADSSFVRGAMFYQKHFFQGQGVSEQTLILSTDARLDTATALPALRRTLDGIAERLAREFPVLYQRDLQDPLGSSRNRGSSKQVGLLDQLTAGAIDRIARDAYVGKTGRATRIDLGLAVEARSDEAMDQVPGIRSAVLEVVDETGLLNAIGATEVHVDLTGETPLYRDMRDLRRRDFRIVAGAAVTVVWLILVWLIRSPLQSLVLVTATLLTYFATYGITWMVFYAWYGLDGLSWQIHFLLFIIILSLGQDYNIYVVTRIREELTRHPPREAVENAIRKTGRVVSSCGVIMAATFASLLAGTLVLMKEFAVAFAVGILIDTFVVRPLLVPALILLLHRRDRATRSRRL
ncbi:MAG: MMPL family transporter, partial [Planctomycetes bacterium]|nr:MMPL family transporter [Planctomycetota bacterium]